MNFSAQFIPNLANIAEPLRELTRKDVPFKWGKEQEAAFETLKSNPGRAETLAYFDRNVEVTKLITDAGPVNFGAVLTQVQEGQERVIAYASRALTGVERRYSQTEREALGLVWGCERIHMYLYGMEFRLLTDHKPLETIYSTSSRNSARIERCVLRLEPYKLRVQYEPGKQNLTDSFSQLVDMGGLSGNDEAEESATDQQISQLRECISTGDWGKAPPQYNMLEMNSLP